MLKVWMIGLGAADNFCWDDFFIFPYFFKTFKALFSKFDILKNFIFYCIGLTVMAFLCVWVCVCPRARARVCVSASVILFNTNVIFL